MEYINDNFARKRQLEQRTMRFAVATLQFLDSLPPTNSTRIICYQLGKSASSIGANYREANGSESRPDFVHKIGIVLKEAKETEYWLEVLTSLMPQSERLLDLKAEASEFVRMFLKARKSLLEKDATNGAANEKMDKCNGK